MHKENDNNKEPKRLFLELALWVHDLKDFQDFEEQEETIEFVYESFLTSSFADDNEDRNNAIVIFGLLKKLYRILHQFSDEDFRNYLVLTNKLDALCTTETVN